MYILNEGLTVMYVRKKWGYKISNDISRELNANRDWRICDEQCARPKQGLR